MRTCNVIKCDSVSHEEFLQSTVLFSKLVSLSTCRAERLFQAKDFLLESFDIQLFPLAVCSGHSMSARTSRLGTNVPLCLSIQLLTSSQSWFAVRLGTSPFRSLSICTVSTNKQQLQYIARTSCCLLFSQILEETKLCKWAL